MVQEGGIFRLDALMPYRELVHGISVRLTPEGEDWNLSSKRGTPQHPPSMERALRNRERLAAALGISPRRMVSCRQVHGSDVIVVGEAEAGIGIYPELGPTPDSDALVTGTPGLYLMALSADCPPVFLYDPVRRVVGLAHSGWKGTVARIAANVVATMHAHFGSQPSDIVAAVGPGIGSCCYRVGENVVSAAEESFGPGAWQIHPGAGAPILHRDGEESYFNLGEAIRTSLLDAGVPTGQVSVLDACTGHNTAHFYSHRIEAGQCGLFGAVLGMRDTSERA
jgi:polyphenol oxidase